MRIGIYGGSFNPPHIGHMILAECAREALSLDLVLFVPAWRSPFKEGESLVPAALRAEMVQLAITGNTGFEGEYWEAQREQLSYTVETLRHVQDSRPGAELFLLMGSDTYRDFPAWREPDAITGMASIAVAQRAGLESSLDEHEYSRRALPFPMPRIEVSSSDIRRRVRERRSIRYLVPWTVKTFIEAHGLYREG